MPQTSILISSLLIGSRETHLQIIICGHERVRLRRRQPQIGATACFTSACVK